MQGDAHQIFVQLAMCMSTTYMRILATMPHTASPFCHCAREQRTHLDVRLVQTARDQLGRQQTQGLHVRGAACCHAMQGILSAMMAGRQAPESKEPIPTHAHVVASRKRSSKKHRRRRHHDFFASHRVPTLYTSQKCVASQALILSLERTGRTLDFQIVDVSQLGHVPSPLATIPALVDKNGIYDGPDLIDVISKYDAVQTDKPCENAKRNLQK